jgi:hypothetical protein
LLLDEKWMKSIHHDVGDGDVSQCWCPWHHLSMFCVFVLRFHKQNNVWLLLLNYVMIFNWKKSFGKGHGFVHFGLNLWQVICDLGLFVKICGFVKHLFCESCFFVIIGGGGSLHISWGEETHLTNLMFLKVVSI